MKKVITLGMVAMSLLMATVVKAQNKIGYVSISEVVNSMPEYKKASSELAEFDSALQLNYVESVKEYQKKDSLFRTDSGKWSPVIKKARLQELQKLTADLQSFQQSYQEQVNQKQEQLLAPIQQKAVATIQEVAKTNGYTYVFNKEVLFSYPDSDDLMPLIRKKMGWTAPVAVPGGVKPKTN